MKLSYVLTHVSEVEIHNIIKTLKNKPSSAHDEISTNLIEYVATEITLPLSFIINNSLNKDVFHMLSKLP